MARQRCVSYKIKYAKYVESLQFFSNHPISNQRAGSSDCHQGPALNGYNDERFGAKNG
jgi:hypothetical protein